MRTSLFALVAVTVTTSSASLVYPESFPIQRRQDAPQPGTPEYACHENCGGVIVDARTESYCTSSNFTSALNACLDCALEFDIWQYYGDSVAAAATACGLDAAPVAANATNTTSATTSASAAATTTGSATSSAAGASTASLTSTSSSPVPTSPTIQATASVVSNEEFLESKAC